MHTTGFVKIAWQNYDQPFIFATENIQHVSNISYYIPEMPFLFNKEPW